LSNISCIIYPPTLEYNYLIQRPQQLMRSFSELGIPAFFLNNGNVYSGEKRGVRKLNENFYLVYDVNPMPLLGENRPVVYYTSPAHVETVKTYNPCLVVFDSVDEPSEEFEAWRPNYYRAVSSADIVLAASDKLYRMASAINPRVYLVPNACDYDYFSGNSSNYYPIDQDILDIAKPIIGYIGVVASWCDLDLIAAIADNFPHYNIVIIGPLYNISEVPRRKNLHWLGFKPYEKLAAYAKYFDAGIIPFKNTSMTQSVNPIKMWEYMAAGIPVVTTALPEAQKHGDLVLYSENKEEFIRNINIALYDDSDLKRQLRQNKAKQNSWMERARYIIEIIENEMQARNIATSTHPVGITNDILQNTSWENMSYYLKHHSLSPGNSCINVANKTDIRCSFGLSRSNLIFRGTNAENTKHISGNRINTRSKLNRRIEVKRAVRFSR